ncbi:MAG: MFS transporter [Pseudomonadota bacterium]
MNQPTTPGNASPAPLSTSTIPLWMKMAFGIGAVGETIYLGMFNTFITIYYNQAVGLSNSLIGTAILMALVVDAVSDPAIGIVSDRWRSRMGRRHPFLFVAPVPLGLALWCIFNPPEALTDKTALAASAGQMYLFAWLAFWTIISRICLTLYVIPHLALGGEMVREQHERSQLFSINALFGYSTGALFIFVAWSVFLSGETINAEGVAISNHLQAASYGPLSLFAGAAILMTVSLCAMGTYPSVPFLSQPIQQPERLSIGMFLRKVLSTLKNRNYLFLLLGFFFFMISSGLYETFSIFIQTYFWEIGPDEIRWLGLGALPGALLGASIAPRLMRRFDRKPVLTGAIIGLVIMSQLIIDLRLLGWFPENDSELLLPLLIANSFLFALSLGVAGVAIVSMLADIIDENELYTGAREEGLFYSARAFFAKMSSSVGHFVAGLMLDWFVRMPFDAVPGQLEEDVIFRLGLAAGPIMATAAAISVLFYSRYNLTRERHADILDQLRARAAEGAASLPDK